MVEDYIMAMDAEGAARELALILRLDRDAQDLLEWAIEESHEAALWKYREEAERAEIGGDHP